jgi:hypothetical protein
VVRGGLEQTKALTSLIPSIQDLVRVLQGEGDPRQLEVIGRSAIDKVANAFVDLTGVQRERLLEQFRISRPGGGEETLRSAIQELGRRAEESGLVKLAEDAAQLSGGLGNAVSGLDGLSSAILEVAEISSSAASVTESFSRMHPVLDGVSEALSAFSVLLLKQVQARVGAEPAQRRAAGGLITGSGGPTEDRVPVLASPGEFVLNARSVSRLGVPLLQQLNNVSSGEDFPFRFQTGGLVPSRGLRRRQLLARSRGFVASGLIPASIVDDPTQLRLRAQALAREGLLDEATQVQALAIDASPVPATSSQKQSELDLFRRRFESDLTESKVLSGADKEALIRKVAAKESFRVKEGTTLEGVKEVLGQQAINAAFETLGNDARSNLVRGVINPISRVRNFISSVLEADRLTIFEEEEALYDSLSRFTGDVNSIKGILGVGEGVEGGRVFSPLVSIRGLDSPIGVGSRGFNLKAPFDLFTTSGVPSGPVSPSYAKGLPHVLLSGGSLSSAINELSPARGGSLLEQQLSRAEGILDEATSATAPTKVFAKFVGRETGSPELAAVASVAGGFGSGASNATEGLLNLGVGAAKLAKNVATGDFDSASDAVLNIATGIGSIPGALKGKAIGTVRSAGELFRGVVERDEVKVAEAGTELSETAFHIITALGGGVPSIKGLAAAVGSGAERLLPAIVVGGAKQVVGGVGSRFGVRGGTRLAARGKTYVEGAKEAIEAARGVRLDKIAERAKRAARTPPRKPRGVDDLSDIEKVDPNLLAGENLARNTIEGVSNVAKEFSKESTLASRVVDRLTSGKLGAVTGAVTGAGAGTAANLLFGTGTVGTGIGAALIAGGTLLSTRFGRSLAAQLFRGAKNVPKAVKEGVRTTPEFVRRQSLRARNLVTKVNPVLGVSAEKARTVFLRNQLAASRVPPTGVAIAKAGGGGAEGLTTTQQGFQDALQPFAFGPDDVNNLLPAAKFIEDVLIERGFVPQYRAKRITRLASEPGIGGYNDLGEIGLSIETIESLRELAFFGAKGGGPGSVLSTPRGLGVINNLLHEVFHGFDAVDIALYDFKRFFGRTSELGTELGSRRLFPYVVPSSATTPELTAYSGIIDRARKAAKVHLDLDPNIVDARIADFYKAKSSTRGASRVRTKPDAEELLTLETKFASDFVNTVAKEADDFSRLAFLDAIKLDPDAISLLFARLRKNPTSVLFGRKNVEFFDDLFTINEGLGFAFGGPVKGPGGPRSDRVPILASDGEFVLNAGAVSKLGLPIVEMLNRGQLPSDLPRFQDGGSVGVTNTGAISVEVNTAEIAAAIQDAIQTALETEGLSIRADEASTVISDAITSAFSSLELPTLEVETENVQVSLDIPTNGIPIDATSLNNLDLGNALGADIRNRVEAVEGSVTSLREDTNGLLDTIEDVDTTALVSAVQEVSTLEAKAESLQTSLEQLRSELQTQADQISAEILFKINEQNNIDTTASDINASIIQEAALRRQELIRLESSINEAILLSKQALSNSLIRR